MHKNVKNEEKVEADYSKMHNEDYLKRISEEADLQRVSSLENGTYVYDEQIEDYYDRNGNHYETKTTEKTVKRTVTTRTPPPKVMTEKIYQDFMKHYQDADEFMKRDIKPLEHIIDGFLTVGMTILASEPKFGKSFLAVSICEALAKGEDFLGLPVTRPYKSFYIPLEDMEEGLHERFDLLGKSEFGGNFNFMFRNEYISNDYINIDLLQEVITREGIELLIIDTLAQFTEGFGGSGNAYQNETVMLKPLHELARRNKIALLVLTHTNQAKYNNGDQKKISGSTAMSGSSDNYWIWDNRGITVKGRFLKEKTFPFFWSEDLTKMMRVPIKAGSGKKKKSNAEILLPEVQLGEWFSNKDLVEKFEEEDMSRQKVTTVINKWLLDGKIEQQGSGSAVKYKWISID